MRNFKTISTDMKKIILSVLAVATLASCAKDEVITAPQGDAIAFDNAFVDNSVRAAVDPSKNTDNLESFVVYGTTKGNEAGAAEVNIFPGVTVTRGTVNGGVGTKGWMYGGDYVQYWITGNTYEFAAVVNGNVTCSNDLAKMPVSIAYTADGATDLLYAIATATGQASRNEAVAFTFNHLLSKVKFTVKNTISTNTDAMAYTYAVTDVKITNAWASGTYTIGNATPWVGANNTYTTEFGDVKTDVKDVNDGLVEYTIDGAKVYAVAGTKSAESANERLLIPNTTSLNVTCSIDLLLNGNVVDHIDYDKNVTLNLAAGKAYNFVISLGNPGDKIEFTVTKVDDWDYNVNNDTTVDEKDNVEVK